MGGGVILFNGIMELVLPMGEPHFSWGLKIKMITIAHTIPKCIRHIVTIVINQPQVNLTRTCHIQ